MPSELIAGLRVDVGDAHVATHLPDRVAYSRDLWPRCQLDRLVGDAPHLPDAVVWPSSEAEVAAVVRRCARAGVPIVPFGAGSGVCGATLPAFGDRGGGVVVDLKRLKAIRRIDPRAGEIEVEAGLMGELLERRLEHRGLTLGHFPSSILCSTVGGWVAGRSAGQCSSRYGKIEDMVLDLTVVTGDGVVRRTPRTDALAVGPDWNQLIIGSEGTLGVICAATLRVHPAPAHRAFRGWLVPDIRAGREVMRETMQAGLRPAVLRLYDPLDTMMVGTEGGKSSGPSGKLKGMLKGGPGASGRALRLILARPRPVNALIERLPRASLLVAMSEGSRDEAIATDAAIAHAARRAGARDLGEGPGRNWLAHRYDVSYKQSAIYEGGGFVDTFEVATTWSRLTGLYAAVRQAAGRHVVVMAHFSHAYPGGCSIYFTFVGSGRDASDMRRRYDAAWRAGLDAAQSQGAVIAHHHGAGLSRASHMASEHGEARRWFVALKRTLDPHGILNPGKLFVEGRG